MINGNIKQFLDTGWFSESTLFLNGYVYWCEAQTDPDTNITKFFIDKWRAENEGNKVYHTLLDSDGTLEWERVFEIEDTDLDKIKKKFLNATIFDGKTFWDVENKIAWLEEGEDIKLSNNK